MALIMDANDLLFLTQLRVYLLHLFWPKVKNSAKSQLMTTEAYFRVGYSA